MKLFHLCITTLVVLSFAGSGCKLDNSPVAPVDQNDDGPVLADRPGSSDPDLSHRGHRRPAGLVIVESNRSFDETYNTLLAALENNPAIGVVATLDHAANATSAGLELPPTREVFFGNPNLGTPLMQKRQRTGIDLPQKMLIWQDEDDRVFVAYNSVKYLRARHRLFGVRDQLDTIAGALRNFSGVATDNEVDDRVGFFGLLNVRLHPGLVFLKSSHRASDTFERLKTAIDNAGPLNILFALEHDQNAANVGLELRPTKLVAFGNPALGTPLMQSRRSIGIDLPQKFLVFENRRGDVYIAYNDPFFVARRHGVRDRDDQLNTIAGALANLAAGAAGP